MTKDDAIKAIEAKRIADPSGYAIDVAFNDAIDIAIEAVRALPDDVKTGKFGELHT